MPLTAYADSGALATWLGAAAPANATQLLRSASVVVAAAANRDIYTDQPTTSDAAVLADATCAQAAAWIALGINPDDAGLDSAPVKGTKIGTADLTYDTTGLSEARIMAATQLAPTAREILYTAGLLALELPVWTSDTDRLADYGLSRPPIDHRWPSRDLSIDWPVW